MAATTIFSRRQVPGRKECFLRNLVWQVKRLPQGKTPSRRARIDPGSGGLEVRKRHASVQVSGRDVNRRSSVVDHDSADAKSFIRVKPIPLLFAALPQRSLSMSDRSKNVRVIEICCPGVVKMLSSTGRGLFRVYAGRFFSFLRTMTLRAFLCIADRNAPGRSLGIDRVRNDLVFEPGK